MDALSILAQGIVPDIGGKLREIQERRDKSELKNFLRQNGAALAKGDTNALAQLMGLNPELGMQVQGLANDRERLDLTRRSTEAGMANDAEMLKITRGRFAQETAAHAAKMDAAEFEQSQAEAKKRMASARVAYSMGADAWDRWNDDHPDFANIGYDDAPMAIAALDGISDGFSGSELMEVSPSATLFDPFSREPVFTAPSDGPDLPADVREYQFAQTPEGGGFTGTFEQFVKTKVPSTTINLPGAGAASPLGSREVATDVVIEDIGRARELVEGSPWYDPAVGMGSGLAEMIRGSRASNVRELTSTIRANIGLDKLRAMKEASPNGASGLGQTTDKDLARLEAALGSLEQSQSEDQFLENLERLDRIYRDVADALQKLKALDEQTGGGAQGSSVDDAMNRALQGYK